jgi:lipoprotein-releasing system permease protein
MPSVPFFISKRYTLSKKDSRFISLISTISVIGISLGVAALIIALSILNGFEETITNKIVDFDSHIKISSYKHLLPDYEKNQKEIKDIVHPYDIYVNPYLSSLVIIGTKQIKEGVSLKGINPFDSWSGLRENITAGSFDLTEGSEKIIIGQKLANKLHASVNDELTVFALKDNQLPSPQNLPNIMKLRISGIFESGMAAYDDLIAYINLESSQDLFAIGNNINGYDIRINNISKIDSLNRS